MSNELTWKDIYNEFRQLHPNMKKQVADYRPHSYLTIVVYMKDGSKVLYDYTTKRCSFLREQ